MEYCYCLLINLAIISNMEHFKDTEVPEPCTWDVLSWVLAHLGNSTSTTTSDSELVPDLFHVQGNLINAH